MDKLVEEHLAKVGKALDELRNANTATCGIIAEAKKHLSPTDWKRFLIGMGMTLDQGNAALEIAQGIRDPLDEALGTIGFPPSDN